MALRFGDGGRVGGVFGFVDGGDTFDVEFFVVGVAGDGVDLESLHQQDADADVGFFVGGEPDFVVDIGLLENEAGSLLQIGEEAAGEAEVADEIGFEASDVVGLFVDPDDAGEFVDDFFDQFVRLEFGIGLEIENQNVLAAETFAARIDELAGAQKGFDADVIIVIFLSFLLPWLFRLWLLSWLRFSGFLRFLFGFSRFLSFARRRSAALPSFLTSVEISSPSR